MKNNFFRLKPLPQAKPLTGILLLLLLLLSLMSAAVVAAGGGGGGGSSSVKKAYSDLKCTDAGGITFSRAPDFSPVIIETADGLAREIPGTWSKGIFTSEEALLREAGIYTVNDPKLGKKKVACPGFKFSCSLIELTLNSCVVHNNQLQLDLSLQGEGAAVDDLNFKIRKRPGSPIQYSWGSAANSLTNVENNNLGNSQYQLKATVTEPITAVQVSYPGCIGRNYVYSTIDCAETSEQANREVQGKKLKCGGLLEINDRVRCRLQLRTEQKDEYENFFPEYCRSEDEDEQEQCLSLYKKAQPCWNQTQGTARSACFQRQLALGQIREEKAACQQLAGNEKGKCLASLRDNVDHLVLLRMYSLEEEAERLMNQGKLTEDAVIEFTVKIEQLKVDYDRAEDKNKKKQIIIEARQEWIKLVRMIK